MSRKVIGLPSIGTDSLLFKVKDVSHEPDVPTTYQAFKVAGVVDLFGMKFLGVVWVIATVEYPEEWWEEIIPIIGAPQVSEMAMVVGGSFEVLFSKGFSREGEYGLTVKVFAGPTFPTDSIVLPPLPAVASDSSTFMVSGEGAPDGDGDVALDEKTFYIPVGEVPAGDTVLDEVDFFIPVMEEQPEDVILDEDPFYIPVVEEPTEDEILDEKSFYVPVIAALITFGVRPWGTGIWAPTEKWACYYWDPNKKDFVGDGYFHSIPDTRTFKDVLPGGYVVAFLMDFDGNISPQYTSRVFSAVDGGLYQFDLGTLQVYKVG